MMRVLRREGSEMMVELKLLISREGSERGPLCHQVP